MVPVFAVPSGAAMRYAAVIAGNDGMAVPASSGGAFYYLVSARNSQECPGEDPESLLGRDSHGTPIPNPFPCQ